MLWLAFIACCCQHAGDRCSGCNGSCLVNEKKTFEVPIEPGMKNSQKITLRGEAGCTEAGLQPGDVILVLQQKEHDVFTRLPNPADIVMEKHISLKEALCGCRYVCFWGSMCSRCSSCPARQPAHAVALLNTVFASACCLPRPHSKQLCLGCADCYHQHLKVVIIDSVTRLQYWPHFHLHTYGPQPCIHCSVGSVVLQFHCEAPGWSHHQDQQQPW